MMRLISIVICLLFMGCGNSQELASCTVSSGSYDRIDCPIAVPFSIVGADLKSQEWQLVEIIENTSISKAAVKVGVVAATVEVVRIVVLQSYKVGMMLFGKLLVMLIILLLDL